MTEREHVWCMLDGTEVTVDEPRPDRREVVERLKDWQPGGALVPPPPKAFARLLNEERAGR